MRCTAPGGYVELCEYSLNVWCDDGSVTDDNPLRVYINHLSDSLEKMGRTVPTRQSMTALLENDGFEDVQATEAKEPIGPWAKDPRSKRIGAMNLLNTDSVFESYGMAAFTRVLGMDNEKVREICEAARLAARNKNYYSYGL